MYKILGADLKEYGPVSAEQIIQWINEGRLDDNSKVQTEGSGEWRTLNTVPEFAAALAAKAAKDAPPLTPPTGNEALAERVLARGYNLDAMRCVSRSWDLVMKHFWLLVGASFVVGLVQGALPIIGGVLQGGLFVLFLKLVRGQKAEFGDAFSGFSDLFLQLFLVGLVAGLLTALGVICCIIPGIIIGVWWMFAVPLAADRKMDFWLAMETSRKVISRHWWNFLLLALLNIGVSIIGLLVCCVGIYVAMPITIGALAYAYEDVFSSAAQSPAQSL